MTRIFHSIFLGYVNGDKIDEGHQDEKGTRVNEKKKRNTGTHKPFSIHPRRV
jgi:hypothetical protein